MSVCHNNRLRSSQLKQTEREGAIYRDNQLLLHHICDIHHSQKPVPF